MLRALTLVLALAAPAAAQEEVALQARQAFLQMEAAQEALAEAERAADRVKALTLTIRAYEEGLAALREGIRRAAIREAGLRRRFEAQREKVMQLVSALQSIEAARTPLLLLHPAGPLGTARSGMIVGDITPGLQEEAERLRADLEEIAQMRALQEGAAALLEDGLQEVQQARTALSLAIADRTDLPTRLVDDNAALTRLLESADTLQSFASGLAALNGANGAQDVILDFTPTGDIALPVAGTVLHHAGDTDAAGIARPGIVIATEPRALVTTPWAATIRYRGPLLDYGNVMILEPGSGYLLVLAGLEEVYGEEGQVLPAGSPLGLMGGIAPDEALDMSNLAQGNSVNRTETLYIEVRHEDRTLDPADWFAID